MVRVDLSKQRYGLFLNVANFRGGKAKGTAFLSENSAHILLLINPLNPPVNTIRMSADAIRLSADAIRKPADSLIVLTRPPILMRNRPHPLLSTLVSQGADRSAQNRLIIIIKEKNLTFDVTKPKVLR